LVIRSLERAEDIPPEALAEGLPWTWQTLAEYLDAVDRVPKGLNYAAAIGHSALRTWTMGERAFEMSATDDDVSAMERELTNALRAGAAGFTTSRGKGHATSDGKPVASRLATWAEVAALVGVVGRERHGVFQLAPERSTDPEEQVEFERRLQALALETGVPIVFGLFATTQLPQPSIDLVDKTVALGGEMWALTHCRGIVSVQSFLTRLAFDAIPEWHEVRGLPHEAQKLLLHDPALRSRLVEAAHHGVYADAFGPEARRPHFDSLRVLLSPYPDNPTVADEAARRGIDPVEAMIDISLERNFDVFFAQDLVPQEDELLLSLLRHPRTAMGFSDSGAHLSQIFDSSIYSYFLGYWVREREAVRLESAIEMMTSRPAAIWGLHDRGRIAPGFAADITVFDPDTVGPRMPTVVDDLPGGAHRLEQLADGFIATIVNGSILTMDGEATEARSGQLLRSYPER
jgi:N-acyl-D-aspartate/D-glutamate deacylase